MATDDPVKEEVTCAKCGFGPYVPSIICDFYQRGDDPKNGVCERCMLEEAFAPKAVPSEEHLQNVCKLGQGEVVCAFLTSGPGGFTCTKGTSMEDTIRQRLASGSMNAKGDNCSGPPNFAPF